jgi:hypothetical protein
MDACPTSFPKKGKKLHAKDFPPKQTGDKRIGKRTRKNGGLQVLKVVMVGELRW